MKKLLTYLNKKKIATISQIGDFLESQSRMTIFRKLTKLGYVSSCSHSGKYYSLKRIARYNKNGLWVFNSVVFSKYGSLKKTIEFLIDNSSKGYNASELKNIIKVKVDDALLELIKSKRIIRKKMLGVYVYYSKATNLSKKQELTRSDKLQYQSLEVNAVLVDKKYQKGLKASETDLNKLNIQQHEINPSWNYTLRPN